MRLRLTPQDDHLHAVEEASNFNESRYYNFFDRTCGLGGWVRMGNRPNEGYAEMTVCLYLPDGRVGFMFKRPEIEGDVWSNIPLRNRREGMTTWKHGDIVGSGLSEYLDQIIDGRPVGRDVE